MMNLVLIVNASVQQAVTDHLRELDVPGFSVSPVQGHDYSSAQDRVLSARDRVVGFIPRVRVDVLLPADRVDAVLGALCDADTGLSGHGTFWVSPVERFGQF